VVKIFTCALNFFTRVGENLEPHRVQNRGVFTVDNQKGILGARKKETIGGDVTDGRRNSRTEAPTKGKAEEEHSVLKIRKRGAQEKKWLGESLGRSGKAHI